jgi:pimeloyl-ACP methyl ester carboxylesterase
MKPTLLFLPGLGADEALFRHQIDHLRDIVNPLCVDYRDCATRTDMADAALQATSEPFALAGMSLGGWVAQEVVHLAPQRVLKLALLNTWARPQAPEFCQGWHQAIARVEKGLYEQVLQDYLPSLFHTSRLADTELISAFLAMCRRVGPAAYQRELKAMVALEHQDNVPRLRRIACPTVVIHGRQDGVFSLAEHEAIARAIPKAKLVVIEECGHVSPLEQPHRVTALLRDWLLNK